MTHPPPRGVAREPSDAALREKDLIDLLKRAREVAIRAPHVDADVWAESLAACIASRDEPDTTRVRFIGIDPLNPTQGAAFPMIPDSWRFGFHSRGDGSGMTFGLQDDGPYVAYAAVDPERATITKAEGQTQANRSGCFECAYGKVAGCWRCGSRSSHSGQTQAKPGETP